MNFRDLIDECRRRGRPPHRAPRTMLWAARACGISRGHLYNLIDGRKTAPEWTVHRIAKGLKVDPEVVAAALAKSRLEALV